MPKHDGGTSKRNSASVYGARIPQHRDESIVTGASGPSASEFDNTKPTASSQTPSGEQQDLVMPTGARRSTQMPYFAAIPSMSLRRLALRATGARRGEVLFDRDAGFEYEGGSDKYGYGNWAEGLELEDTVNHVIAHLLAWKDKIQSGKVPEDDDLAGAAWGIMFPLMTFEREYAYQMHERGILKENQRSWTPEDDAKFELLHPLCPKA